jgi:hypothetical protein
MRSFIFDVYLSLFRRLLEGEVEELKETDASDE